MVFYIFQNNFFSKRTFPIKWLITVRKSDVDPYKLTMKIKRAEVFGKGIEFTCRYKAEGNFYRRFSDYIEKGHDLGGIVEVNVKSVKRGNPPITLNSMLLFNIMTEEEYKECVLKVKKVAELIKEDLLNKGLTLYDIKFELGKINEDIVLIDEITSENMTVYENDVLIRSRELYKKLIK